MQNNTLVDYIRQEMEAYNNTIVGTQAKYGAEEATKKATELLATALEEQKKEILSEVEDLLMDETLISYASWRRSTRKYGETQEEYERLEDILNNQNQLRAELRTKLNQLKGNL